MARKISVKQLKEQNILKQKHKTKWKLATEKVAQCLQKSQDEKEKFAGV